MFHSKFISLLLAFSLASAPAVFAESAAGQDVRVGNIAVTSGNNAASSGEIPVTSARDVRAQSPAAAAVEQKNQMIDFLRDFLEKLKTSDNTVVLVVIISVNGEVVPTPGTPEPPTNEPPTNQPPTNEPPTNEPPVNPPPANLPPAAGQLVSTLQSSNQTSSFNLIFGTHVPANGSPTEASDIQLLSDLTGDPSFNASSFSTVLPKTSALYSALQSSGSQLEQFNRLFGTNLPASGAPGADDRKPLFDVAGDPNFNQSNFLGVLDKAASLDAALKADSAKLSAFNAQFKTSLQTSGAISASDRTTLFNVAGDPNFNLDAFLGSLGSDQTPPPAGGETPGTLPPAAEALLTTLQTGNQIQGFNTLFGTNLPANGSPTAASDVQLLSDLTGDPQFNGGSFIAVLPKTTGLLSALQSNADARANFNTRFGANLQASGSPSTADRTVLFNLAGDPNFNQEAFLGSLTPSTVPALPPAASSLLTSLQNNSQIAAFNALYGTNLPTSGATTTAGEVQLLADLTGDPSFDAQAFTTVLPKAAGLLSALQNAQLRLQAFNRLFNTNLPAAGSPSAADRKPLFDTAGDPAYDQSTFLNVLERTASLHQALTADAGLLSRFNSQFNASLGTGNVSAANRTALFNIAGDPNFNLQAFVGSLSTAPALTTSLRGTIPQGL